ncbi:O-antigen ligase family protein [Shewanella baltica]|uniref:O-antigen ligase family protein n=1 Tax=Shewanella baltica TaxID=62322 RepID=UPI000DF90921|nr:O-antigen ligase family protein [Shewanella baltica]SUI41879.1 Lipid A core - O-antigen ligase and related enzymes [Shewanella baltica]
MILSHAFSRIILFLFFAIFFMGSLLSGYLSGFAGLGNSYDLKRILVIVFVMVAMVLLSYRKSVPIAILSPYTCWVVSVIFILGFISALNSKHPFWSLLELANFLLLLCLFYIVGVLIADIGKTVVLQYFFWFALFFSVCISVKFFLLLLFHALDANRPDVHSLVAGFMNVRFFNQLQVMLLPLLCLSFYIEQLKKYKRAAMLAFSVLWLILLQSEARGALLAMVVAAFVVYSFLSADLRKAFIRPIMKAVTLGTLLWLVLIIIIPLFLFDSQIWQLRTNSSGRIDMWIYILQTIPEHVWLGYGPMSFAWAEARPLPSAHPHNALLQFLYEFGVVVFILLASWSLIKLRAILKRFKLLGAKSSEHLAAKPQSCINKSLGKSFDTDSGIDTTDIVLVFALCAVWVYAMFDGVIVMPLSQALLMALLALNCRQYQPRAIALPLKVALVAIVIICGALLITSLGDAALNQQLYPRLWLTGIING